MSTIKEFNNKIKSLKNTQKITRTMKMVSASKLRRAHEAQASAKQYAHNVTGLIRRLSASVDRHLHPLLQPHAQVNRALILVITSDKGLCGAFNHNAHKHVLAWIRENHSNFQQIDLSFCGRRGYMFFKKRSEVRNYYEGSTANPNFQDAVKIGNNFIDDYVKGTYDEIYIAYNQFFSPLLQKTVFEKLLPIDPEALTSETDNGSSVSNYLFEPKGEELLNFLIPHYLYFKIYFALLENSAGEHGARMSAMDNATKNASELIDSYTLLRNRARQAAITTELTEIVAGAESIR